MGIAFNHTIVHSQNREESARFFVEVFGLADAVEVGHFLNVELEYRGNLDFATVGGETITPQHYAFLVTEDDFDAIYGRITARGIIHWADPRGQHPDEINHNDGGRGVYFRDPSGHYLEIITRPYGSGE
ncbi:VOC family protein [Mycobacterium sp. CBMA271]|uniref:VOC family protein n=1 Tax=unclassified Mycobacteroides TaxID=2618759 RepID=UPI0012DF09B3|nr:MULTISPECIES: VOC family protein [unclassified Mycobacteroides]MUM16711.1 bleomycin resistance protein [Mycobacteroides sp. CBMA 326]MUM22922.1 VOC family protein [Mycobacteroides sp. CBMA 271]